MPDSPNEIIKKFNNIAIEFITQLKAICPRSIIANNAKMIKGVITTENTKNVMIEQYIFYVLKYKDKIDAYDEEFFLSEATFDKEIGGSLSILSIINEIKEVWTTICEDDRRNIFDYMRVLCYYSQEYFLLSQPSS